MLALHFPDGSRLSVNVGDMHVVGRGQHGLDDLEVSQSQFAVSCASQDGSGGLRVSALGLNRASSLVLRHLSGRELTTSSQAQAGSQLSWWRGARAWRTGLGKRFTCLMKDTCAALSAHTLTEPCLLSL